MVSTYTFSADSVRAYVFQQLLCITYALNPYGSKLMIHGFFPPQDTRATGNTAKLHNYLIHRRVVDSETFYG
jgi:hypothetical protein